MGPLLEEHILRLEIYFGEVSIKPSTYMMGSRHATEDDLRARWLLIQAQNISLPGSQRETSRKICFWLTATSCSNSITIDHRSCSHMALSCWKNSLSALLPAKQMYCTRVRYLCALSLEGSLDLIPGLADQMRHLRYTRTSGLTGV